MIESSRIPGPAHVGRGPRELALSFRPSFDQRRAGFEGASGLRTGLADLRVEGRPEMAPQAIEKARFAPGNGRPPRGPIEASDCRGRPRIESADGHNDGIEGGEAVASRPQMAPQALENAQNAPGNGACLRVEELARPGASRRRVRENRLSGVEAGKHHEVRQKEDPEAGDDARARSRRLAADDEILSGFGLAVLVSRCYM